MFDRIAPRYDLLNRLLSFGRDTAWRGQLPHLLPPGNDLSLLDLATGTGDVALTLVKQCPRIKNAVGIDMAEKMLAIGREKIKKQHLDQIIQLKHGDASAIPEPGTTASTLPRLPLESAIWSMSIWGCAR